MGDGAVMCDCRRVCAVTLWMQKKKNQRVVGWPNECAAGWVDGRLTEYLVAGCVGGWLGE